MTLSLKQINYNQFIFSIAEQLLTEGFKETSSFLDSVLQNIGNEKVYNLPARAVKQHGLVGFYEYDTDRVYAASKSALTPRSKELGVAPDDYRQSVIAHELTHRADRKAGLNPFTLSGALKTERNATGVEALLQRRNNKQLARNTTQNASWTSEFDKVDEQVWCPTCRRSPVTMDTDNVSDKEFVVRSPREHKTFSGKKVKMPELNYEEPTELTCPHCSTSYTVTNFAGNWRTSKNAKNSK